MKIAYDYRRNVHTAGSARVALAMLLADQLPNSLLDVGCGPGLWTRAALAMGIEDTVAMDGVTPPNGELGFPPGHFREVDLAKSWNLERRFDVALCLEVAEHLPEESAPALVASLTRHADWVIFSAACPGQLGQHHVNCRWPAYWQGLFNERGFICDDSARWILWQVDEIEPWYRQNVFFARRSPEAGSETRIPAVIHPAMLPLVSAVDADVVPHGGMPAAWYLALTLKAVSRKLSRWMRRRGDSV